MKESLPWKWLFLAWAPFLLVFLAIVYMGRNLPQSAVEPQATAPSRTLTLTGEGTVEVSPDIAWVRVGVSTEADQAQEAVEENARRTEQIFQAVRKLGLPEEDIQTGRFELYPKEERDRDGRLIRRFFVVEHRITLTVRDLAQVGQVLDAALTAGANRVYGVTFGVADPQSILQEARVRALQNAFQQAQAAAEAAGVELVRVQTLSFGSVVQPRMQEALAFDMMRAAPEVPVAPGTLEFKATVTVVFEIR